MDEENLIDNVDPLEPDNDDHVTFNVKKHKLRYDIIQTLNNIKIESQDNINHDNDSLYDNDNYTQRVNFHSINKKPILSLLQGNGEPVSDEIYMVLIFIIVYLTIIVITCYYDM
jgi:hypothetical protein